MIRGKDLSTERKEDEELKAFWPHGDKCPRVFLDIAIENQATGRLEIKLLHHEAPKTCENFRALCTGEKGIGLGGKPLHFANTYFNTIIPGFFCQAGDIAVGNGVGGPSIYGSYFDDEAFKIKHSRRGILSMSNKGPNTNGSQFFITFAEASWLDGKHVAFGEVVRGMKVLRRIENCGTEPGRPLKTIKIVGCGQVQKPMLNPKEYSKYKLEIQEAKLAATKDSKKLAEANGFPQKMEVQVWLTPDELSQGATQGEFVIGNIYGYSAKNIDGDNPKQFIPLVIVRLKKRSTPNKKLGRVKKLYLQLHELQKRMLGKPKDHTTSL